MESFLIPVTMFRQILILPVTLGSGTAEDIPGTIHKFARDLEGKDGWHEVPDHLNYLRDPATLIDQHAYAEFVYFHPYIQRFLYDRPSQQQRPLRLFRRTNTGAFDVGVRIKGEALGLTGADADKKVLVEISLPVDRICLYLFELGVAILVVEVGTGFDPKVTEDGVKKPLSLAHAQSLQNALRRIYPPYFLPETIKSDHAGAMPEYPAYLRWSESAAAPRKPSEWIGHVKNRRRNPIDPVWQRLFAPLALEGEEPDGTKVLWQQIIDERIPSMLLLGVRDSTAVERSDFTRLCFVDEPGRGYFYAEDFLRDFEERYCYDRFRNYGTRYMFSGYSMVMFGTGDPDNDDDTFHHILREHFRRHYFQMGLLIQLQFATLLSLSQRLSEAAKKEPDGGLQKEIDALEKHFLAFEQGYWFSQISNQLQARELYDLWMKRAGVRTIYQEVRKQIHAANAYLGARAQQEQTEAAVRLSVIATFGVIVGAALAFLGMNVLASPDFLAAFGVPKGVEKATPLLDPNMRQSLAAAHATVFFGILAIFAGLGKFLLGFYDPAREAATKPRRVSVTEKLNSHLSALALGFGVLFLLCLFFASL